MDKDELRLAAETVVQTLRNNGFTAYFAGGCVRDMLMGRTPKDYDIASNALPEQVIELFDHFHEIGKAFGVVQVMVTGHGFEVATFRQDMDYRDGRHPGRIEPSNPQHDAERRDFTINGMFYDPTEKKIIDFVGGQNDLKAGIVRAIGDPNTRFSEDHLRMMRAIRFAGTLGFEIDPATFSAIQKNAETICRVSMERINTELTRTLLESVKPGDALELLRTSGLLGQIIPEALPMVGQEQPEQYHPEGDVWTHVRIMLNMMNVRNPIVAFGILFHDIGKPPTASFGPGNNGEMRIRFNGHPEVGARMTEEIMRRLKFSNDTREAVVSLVARHMRFMEVRNMRESTLRKFVASPVFDDELELHRVDCLSSHGHLDHHDFCKSYRKQFENEPVLPSPLISGSDLMTFGIPEGPEIGHWKKRTFEQQLEEPEWSREQLWNWVQETFCKTNNGG